MCGRFINLIKTNTLKKIFNIRSTINSDLVSYNISPSKNSCIVFKDKDINLNLDIGKWGYSFIDKNKNQEKNIINSRIETIDNKILFKESYNKRKCIIPSNGYYEWSMMNQQKIPFFIHIPVSEPMFLAGIWKYNDFKKDKNKVFSIITKNSNQNIKKIHHRMPVILSIEEAENFLNSNDSSFLNSNFSSSLESELDFYAVSKFVNYPINNSKECIKPI